MCRTHRKVQYGMISCRVFTGEDDFTFHSRRLIFREISQQITLNVAVDRLHRGTLSEYKSHISQTSM